MNKYSTIAVILAVVVGLTIGFIFSTNQKNKEIVRLMKQHELKLKEQNSISEQKIKNYTLKINQLNDSLKLDSIKMSDLEQRIKKDGVVVQQLLKERTTWTNDEKVNFLNSRYAN